MYSRILTDVERKRVKKYLKTDGRRDSTIRIYVWRAKHYKPQIQSDLTLLEELVTKYEETRKVIHAQVRR